MKNVDSLQKGSLALPAKAARLQTVGRSLGLGPKVHKNVSRHKKTSPNAREIV
jgi:hypothetical protein